MEFDLDTYQREVPAVSTRNAVEESYLRGPPPRQVQTVFQVTLGVKEAMAGQARYRVGVVDSLGARYLSTKLFPVRVANAQILF
jgi:hypothetical protein